MESKTCQHCGERFYRPAFGTSAYVGDARWMERRFCSLKCAGEAKRRPRTTGFPCPLCGRLLAPRGGGNHYVRVHGMTASEARKQTGQPTADPDPSLRELIGEEIGEHTGQKRWTDEEIFSALRRAYRRAGYAPTARSWRRGAKHRPVDSLVLERFGSWNVALHMAGIPGVAIRSQGRARRPGRKPRRWRANVTRAAAARRVLAVEQVVRIRERAATGDHLVDLAREYGVSDGAIRQIVRGRTYADVGGPTDARKRSSGHSKPRPRKLTADQARAIREMAVATRIPAIARQFAVTDGTIWAIVRRQTYQDV